MEFRPLLRERSWDIKKENEILELWDKEDIYTFKLIDEKPLFVIDTPPPYASGSWHVAAAAHYAQFDMFARYYKLKGYNILFPMGIDRNGLPIEITIEKIYGIRAKDVDREYFINLCRELLDKYEKEIIEIVKRMGLMANYKNPYKTDSPEYRKITQATFIELWNKNLIYKAERPTIWCPVCHTTIAEAEVEYKQTEGTLYYIRFDLNKGGYVVVATTRPELLGATAALLYNPKDERYKDLKDNKAIIPIYNYLVPILEHPSVKPEFGSGVMMLSSFGDLEDIRLFRELGFKPRILIDKDGKMNKLAGKYQGLSVEEARKAIVKDLKDMGYIIKEEKISQNIPICWRSKNPVEFIITDALYLKQLEFKNEIKKIADEILFLPDFHKQILINWIDGLSIDWAISRDRYYGTEIPIWYCKKCGEPHVPEPGEYYRPWKDVPPFKKCKKCGSTEFIGETRTFDTWFDSSISPLYISGYLRDEKLYKKAFPVTVRPQGIDIVRTWLYYTLLRVYLLTGKPAFKFVRLSGMGLDKHGRPMHKHLGNIVYPLPIIEKYGADAFRLWAASETKLGYNYQFNEEKVRGAKKFINKLWNISRFISSFPYVKDNEINIEELTKIDKEILSLLNSLIDQAEEEYSHLDTF
ncbi:valine--tRNA ligase, partial [Candidatus Geothermarchaeota archaeon]